MTVLTDLRGRLASALRLQLGHAGFTASADVVARLAGRALDDAQVPALLEYVAAAEGAVTGLAVVADGGEAPEDLAELRAGLAARRADLAGDPIIGALLA